MRETKNKPWVYWVIASALVLVGFIAMGASMVMNWRFGWGLASNEVDRYLMATIHTLVDPAAALLIAVGGLMLGLGWRWQGIIAFVLAGVLVAYSVVSVFGFMSERIGQLQGHKAAIDVQKGQLAWLRNQQTSAYNQKGEKRVFRADTKEALQKLQDSVRLIPDRHAQAIANATGLHVETVQLILVCTGSGVAQTIKFVCLAYGFFLIGVAFTLRQAGSVAVNQRTQHGSPGSDGSSGSDGSGEPRKKPDLKSVPKPEPQPARAEPSRKQRSVFYVPSTGAPERNLSAFDRAYEIASQHPYLSTRAIAARAGVSQSTGQRVRERARGKADRIIRKYGNGEGFRPLAYN